MLRTAIIKGMNKLLSIARYPDSKQLTLSVEEVARVRTAAVLRSETSITHQALVQWIDAGMRSDMPLREVLRSIRCNAVALMFKAAEREARAFARVQGKSQRAYYKQFNREAARARAQEKKEFLGNCQKAGEMFVSAEKRFNQRTELKTILESAGMCFAPHARVTQNDINAIIRCKDLSASSRFKKLLVNKTRRVKVCKTCRMKTCSGCRIEPLKDVTDDPFFANIHKSSYGSYGVERLGSVAITFNEDFTEAL